MVSAPFAIGAGIDQHINGTESLSFDLGQKDAILRLFHTGWGKQQSPTSAGTLEKMAKQPLFDFLIEFQAHIADLEKRNRQINERNVRFGIRHEDHDWRDITDEILRENKRAIKIYRDAILKTKDQ